jgi:hypothetical protein
VRNVDGGSWKLKSYDYGEPTCIQNTLPGEAIGTTCLPTSQVFSGGRELLVLPGARQKVGTSHLFEWDNIWIHGLVSRKVARLSRKVARLSVVFTDCSTEPLAVAHDGAFLYVTPTAKIRKDVVPYRVRATGASGQLVDSTTIDVGVPKTAKEAGHKSPEPATGCA